MDRKEILKKFGQFVNNGKFNITSKDQYAALSAFVQEHYETLKTNRRFNDALMNTVAEKKTTNNKIKATIQSLKSTLLEDQGEIIDDGFLLGVLLYRLQKKLSELYPDLSYKDIELLVQFGDDR